MAVYRSILSFGQFVLPNFDESTEDGVEMERWNRTQNLYFVSNGKFAEIKNLSIKCQILKPQSLISLV